MSYKSSDETCGPLSILGKENSMFVPLSKGEVDLWKGLNFNDNYMDVGEDDNYFQGFKHGDLTIEAGKNKTNFMSISRIDLSKELVNLLFDDIIEILNKYIEVAHGFEDIEERIIDIWKNLESRK